jgi:hypothetical protein
LFLVDLMGTEWRGRQTLCPPVVDETDLFGEAKGDEVAYSHRSQDDGEKG